MQEKVRIGALISGTGTNLQAILDACDKGSLAGEVVFIGSDNPDARGLDLGSRYGIPTFVADYTNRFIAGAQLFTKISRYPFDLLVCAGFMRILTPYFIDRVNTDCLRIMNIHPSLLPAFPGTDGYGDTFRYGCKVAGCTVHFIDHGRDTGQIIAQRAFPITQEDTLESVKEKGLALEWELYPECIKLFAQGKLKEVL